MRSGSGAVLAAQYEQDIGVAGVAVDDLGDGHVLRVDLDQPAFVENVVVADGEVYLAAVDVGGEGDTGGVESALNYPRGGRRGCDDGAGG
jgi:hypothetical protein